MELTGQEKKCEITSNQAPSSLLSLICTFLAYAILIFGIVKGIEKAGSKGGKSKEIKVDNNTQQTEGVSHEDIYQKLEVVEKKIESGTQLQKFGIAYAIGAAFLILGLSQWPGLLERLGIDPTRYYANSIFFILLGIYTMILAFFISMRKKNKGRKEK